MNEKPTYEELDYYLSNIPGVVIIDMEGIVIYVNDQCAGYFGLEKNEIMNRHITKVFPPTKMIDGLYREEEGLVFYSTYLGIGISIQIPLFKNGKRFGLLEYDATQGSNNLYNLSKGYNDFLDQELLNVENELIMLENSKYTIGSIIGKAPVTLRLKEEIIAAAKTNSTVIITGETGTGKELVAHSIHNLSERRKKRIVKLNASAFPENLVESELFGYEEGSFTGASKGGKKGKFELANEGTLFIDEINQMPMSIQPKLLRVMQEREVDRIGGEDAIPVDVRVIAATNEPLEDLVRQNRFREDLYYRFNVIEIKIPPLRERKSDIEELVMAKVQELNGMMGLHIKGVEPVAMRALKQYDWPGNIRELHNVIERAMNFSSDDQLTEKDFDMALLKSKQARYIELTAMGENSSESLIEQVKNNAEKELIQSVLRRFDNNKSKAARYLNIDRSLLYQKMKRLGISSK